MLRDEIRRENQKMKDRTFGEKLGYIWEYYRIQIGVALFAAVFVFSFGWTLAHRKDLALGIMVFNGPELATEEWSAGLLTELGADPDQEEIVVETGLILRPTAQGGSYEMLEKTVAAVAAEEVDLFLGDPESMEVLFQSGLALELTGVLPAEGSGLYGDQAALTALREAVSAGETDLPALTLSELPEGMAEPFLVAVALPGEDRYLAVAASCRRLERAAEAAAYLAEHPLG